ncbi:ATP-binding protein [Alicyclobacillus sp. TC]|uniref:ATP-binding protein n=1 Tax=Alicyclobacillus sp. TC TaxID=2606450 RepID=UPI001EE3BC6B|nr:ATP-binding protein [Alicyclobacillus sp. TC]
MIGTVEEAKYTDALLEDYRGNPLIEALPPIWSPRDVLQFMTSLPNIRPEERELERHLRIHCVMRLNNFVHPLNRHVELEQHLSTMIRRGYVSRNPKTPSYARRLRDVALSMQNPDIAELERQAFPVKSSTASGGALVGVSGLGKTTAIERLIMQYPQVVLHPELGHTQVVWVKLDCPHDASLNALCLEFFEVFDELFGTNETERLSHARAMNKDKLLRRMRITAAANSLGILIIDEIQNLKQAKSGGKEQMLNFFVRLVNNIGVPVLLVGTPGVSEILHHTFRNGRRFGAIPGWERLIQGSTEWEQFLKNLWRFQWVKEFSPLTDEIKRVMFHETLGITDLVVKLFAVSQIRAITTKKESLDALFIESVAKEIFYNVRAALDALRSGSEKELRNFDDLYEPIKLADYVDKATEQIQVDAPLEKTLEDEVLDLLVQAGIPEPVAIRAVLKTTCDDKRKWLRAALLEAEQLQNTHEKLGHPAGPGPESAQSDKSTEPKRKRKSPSMQRTPMLKAGKAGQVDKKTPYQSLLEADLIGDPIDVFLKPEVELRRRILGI